MAKRTTTPTTNHPTADTPSAPEKAPARVRGKRHDPAPDAQALDYAELGIAGTDVPKAESLRLEFAELGRRSTSQVFECGRVVAELHELATDQVHFDKLARRLFKLSRTGAGNYERVHHNLQDYRDRLVRLGLPASGLYALSTAEPERVEEVTALLESGQELTVGQIKAIVASGAEAAVVEDGGIEAGGVAGLKALIAEKISTGVPAFMDELCSIQSDIHLALVKHHNGKRVDKGAAQAALVYSARLAAEQLKSLTWTARMAGAPFHPGAVHVRPLAKEGRWYELQKVLERMNFEGKWPDAPEVGPWLADTVVPLIDWALGSRAAEARAAVEQMEKAAEAERVKAEKEKAKAKAAAQKERAKAKAAEKKARKQAGKPKPAPAEPIVVPAAVEAAKRQKVPAAKAAALQAAEKEPELAESGGQRIPPSGGDVPGAVAPAAE